jgi:hypothetical protein
MNNPPAFPTTMHNYGDGKYASHGMTLRDYFAAKAMQGVISGCAARGEVLIYSELAGLSYDIADAMLEAREA